MIRGALMVGGLSIRMGSPKSLIKVGKTTLGLRLGTLLEMTTGLPPVIVGEGRIGGKRKHWTRVPDREPFCGPLSGLLGLFDRFPTTDFLVLATDLIAMNEPALDWLLSIAQPDGCNAIWPRFPDRPTGEPLAAVWFAESSRFLESSWQRGIRGPTRALAPHLRHEPLIPEVHRRAFQGVNRPEDLAEFLKKR